MLNSGIYYISLELSQDLQSLEEIIVKNFVLRLNIKSSFESGKFDKITEIL